jgi:outer membrane murein-binding lipoprotein Lpp
VKNAVLVILAAVLAAATLAAPASSATPTERRLARQVKTLQKQVKALQRQMRNVQSIAAGAVIYGACVSAATADAFQGTWETMDRKGLPDQFAPQTPIADPLNSCQRLEIQRQANPQVTPTTDVFAALLNIFR